MNPAISELIRQGLRWFGVWSLTVGAPDWISQMLSDPEFANAVVGFGSYAIAEIWWAATKVKK